LFRTQRYPMHRAVSCGEASCPRSSGLGIEPGRLIEAQQKLLFRHFDLAHFADQQIAVLIDVTTNALFVRQTLKIALGHRAEAALLPGLPNVHEIAGEAFDQMCGHRIAKAFFLKSGYEWTQSRLQTGHRHRADHPAEHQPWRWMILRSAARPCQSAAANQTLIDQKRIRPIYND